MASFFKVVGKNLDKRRRGKKSKKCAKAGCNKDLKGFRRGVARAIGNLKKGFCSKKCEKEDAQMKSDVADMESEWDLENVSEGETKATQPKDTKTDPSFSIGGRTRRKSKKRRKKRTKRRRKKRRTKRRRKNRKKRTR
jgi:hypothetical protein